MLAAALSSILPQRRALDFGPLSDFWYNPVGQTSSAGIIVKPDNAMQVATVFGCIRLLSEILGMLDIKIYEVGDEEDVHETPAPDHYLWETLFRRPNPWQTPMEWEEMGMAHLCLRGIFLNQIKLNQDGQIELWPLNPDRMAFELLPNGTIKYIYQPKVGQKVIFGPGEIFAVRGMTLDGVTGVSVLEYARHAVGAAIAQETHGASLFKNGGLPTFWIGRPQGSKFTPEAQRTFRQGWRRIHGGADNAGNPPILIDGMELHELGLTNRDSQWLESRQFQGLEICRFFRVPPHMLGFSDQHPKATVEQQSIEFVRYTLGTWATRWEQAIRRDLIDEPKKYRAKINLDDLQRGDMMSRFTAYNVGVQGGWLLANEVRRAEGKNPIEGGDQPRFPANMQPAGGGPDWNEQGGQPGKGKPKGKGSGESGQGSEEDPTAYEKRKQKKQKKAEGRRRMAEDSFRPLLADAAGRIAAAELHALAPRAAKAAADRVAWQQFVFAAAEKQFDYMHKAVAPIAAAWCRQTGELINNTIPEADGAAPFGWEEILSPAADVPKILQRWQTERAGAILKRLEGVFFNAL
jgi:HK97 family phage portal protein